MSIHIKRLLNILNKGDKKKFLIIFLMMIVAALLETIGIGLIVPFVGVITNPGMIESNKILSFFYQSFQFQTEGSFVLFLVAILFSIFVLKNIYLLFFFHIQYKVIFNQQIKLARTLFATYLRKPYTFHLQRNTADLLRNVNGEIPKVFQGIILSVFHLLTEVFVVICIVALLIYTAPYITLAATLLLGLSIFLFFRVFKGKISDLGKEQQRVGGMMIRWVNQGLGASKELKVSGNEDFFINSYSSHSKIQARNNKYMKMLEQVPRLFIETLLVSIVLLMIAMILFQGTNTAEAVSILALFAMAAFRLMPSINRMINMITTIRYSLPALTVIYEDISSSISERVEEHETVDELVLEKGGPIFKKSIQLIDISFKYPNQQEYSIKDVSLRIPIGQSVAFVGESGAGKTTLVDIILGVLEPGKGKLLIDHHPLEKIKKSWQQNIGYIPQTIFLSDDSIRHNIAFGMNTDCIDDQEVWRALEQAQLKEFVEGLPEQLDTSVGERGVRLSGGQRQRIGIARALYHDPEILFMDEATSALDNETEQGIMKSIDQLKGEKTLIIIAHRLSTIENCDVVFKIKNGRLQSTTHNEAEMQTS
ncbi:ABC transporter ATP-binding protein [Alkalihalobacillus pseudalcaliphilus]|uniref:ABC transporter ATP-binding protein n=1 Tax=Alkalihalobacillus pseudalcaliphilus TaxID=79884 RepID=UPI00064DABA0|nr:ABC transporter ATP-binding protein [Alkalihalobacillus pseudalcaliphilus]KMK75030.1 ABC transporter [Alkalihalobacillus pseudalcaliphilus]